MSFFDMFKTGEFKRRIAELTAENESLREQLRLLESFRAVGDVNAYVAAEREKAQGYFTLAKSNAEKLLADAKNEAERIVTEAHELAENLSHDALVEKAKMAEYTAVAAAMRNTIEGYGDEFIKPTYSLLDELAEEYGFSDGGQQLKAARAYSAMLAKTGKAAVCDYVEANRRETAIRFVVDAFNGKVDSILSKSKHDNYGKLEAQIRDAAILVNANGSAFRNARIADEYVEARIAELRWAVVVHELRLRQQEEQKEIRERMREEERAKKEYERAMKEAQKEQEYYQRAMEKARAQLEKASEEERAKYEQQLLEMELKVREAEEKNQRAIAMAQLTRRGTVYIISNIGSFGEDVFKVGMTRRLEPLDRIRELGDASVPFPYDVHAIIESDDAPALETELHKALMHAQMNKVNPRKEFFRTQLSSIRSLVEARGLQSVWTITAEATEYRETLAIEKRIADDPAVRAEWERFMQQAAANEEEDELPAVAT